MAVRFLRNKLEKELRAAYRSRSSCSERRSVCFQHGGRRGKKVWMVVVAFQRGSGIAMMAVVMVVVVEMVVAVVIVVVMNVSIHLLTGLHSSWTSVSSSCLHNQPVRHIWPNVAICK